MVVVPAYVLFIGIACDCVPFGELYFHCSQSLEWNSFRSNFRRLLYYHSPPAIAQYRASLCHSGLSASNFIVLLKCLSKNVYGIVISIFIHFERDFVSERNRDHFLPLDDNNCYWYGKKWKLTDLMSANEHYKRWKSSKKKESNTFQWNFIFVKFTSQALFVELTRVLSQTYTVFSCIHNFPSRDRLVYRWTENGFLYSF